jgi:hypothetical protein
MAPSPARCWIKNLRIPPAKINFKGLDPLKRSNPYDVIMSML